MIQIIRFRHARSGKMILYSSTTTLSIAIALMIPSFSTRSLSQLSVGFVQGACLTESLVIETNRNSLRDFICCYFGISANSLAPCGTGEVHPSARQLGEHRNARMVADIHNVMPTGMSTDRLPGTC